VGLLPPTASQSGTSCSSTGGSGWFRGSRHDGLFDYFSAIRSEDLASRNFGEVRAAVDAAAAAGGVSVGCCAQFRSVSVRRVRQIRRSQVVLISLTVCLERYASFQSRSAQAGLSVGLEHVLFRRVMKQGLEAPLCGRRRLI
jgi:hypothetical protein